MSLVLAGFNDPALPSIVIDADEEHKHASSYTPHNKYPNIIYVCGDSSPCAYCKECKKFLSIDSSNIKKHQNVKHQSPTDWAERMKHLMILLIDMQAPSTIVENKHFRLLFPEFCCSRKTYTGELHSLFIKTKDVIARKLADSESVNIYVDEWTRFGLNYVGVYASTADHDMLLACGVPESIMRDAESLRSYLTSELDAYNITNKIGFASSDCANNVTAAILSAGMNWNPCCCHIVNKAMEKAMSLIKTVSVIQQKVGTLVGSTKLKQFMTQEHANFLTIPTYSQTRWLSTGNMFKRLENSRDEITAFLNSDFNTNDVVITEDEWVFVSIMNTIINDVNNKIKSLENLNKSGFFYAFVTLIEIAITASQELKSNGFPNAGEVLRSYIIEKLKKQRCHDWTVDLVVASILNPNLDTKGIIPKELEGFYKEAVQYILQRLPASSTHGKQNPGFGRREAFVQKNQLEIYSDMVYPGDIDPTIYWKSHSVDLPDLYAIAKRYIGLYPSSACLERSFSMAKTVLQDKYGAISSKRAEERIFLYVNSDSVEEALNT